MKYTCTVTINASQEKVAKLWNDEHYFDQWQDGFESIELLSGKAHEVGSKSKIVLNDKRRIELTETILITDLPREKKALYEHIHMTNTQTTRFEVIDAKSTRYISEVEYTQFNGFLIQLMAKLFPGKFKAQSQKWMDQFKCFVENSNHTE